MLGVRLDTELEDRLPPPPPPPRRYVDLHDDAYRREARRQSTRASARDSASDTTFWQDAAAWK